MATIQSSLQLYDGMSPVLRKITNAMNIAISSLKTCLRHPVSLLTLLVCMTQESN